MEKVLITGANGFIGSHILEYFLKNKVNVTCLARETSKFQYVDSKGYGIREGDISHPNTLAKSFKNIDVVIHNAAMVKDWGPYKQFYEINVQGTLNVLQACVDNQIKDVIMTGSISSYGEENNPTVKNESSDYNSHYKYFMDGIFPNANNHYRDTKALATQKAIEFANKNGLNLTILEPTWVYGEREFGTGFFEYVQSVKNGMFVVPGSKKNKFHVIYAGDLAKAYFSAYQNKLKGVHRIIIGNKKVDKMSVVFSLFCETAGVTNPKYLPKWSLYPTGFILELLYTIFRSKNPPALSRSRVNMFYDNIEYATEKARDLLGFQNEYTLEEGIKKTVQWYKNNQLL